MTLSELIGRPVPFAELLGLRLTPGQPGLSRIELELRPELLNSFHDAHGGVVMTIADVALAVAAITSDGAAKGAVTVSLSVNFVGPGQGKLVAEGRCQRSGGGLAFAEAEIRDGSGKLVAQALGTFKLRR